MNYCETKNLSKAVMMLHDADLAYSFTKNVFHAFISAHWDFCAWFCILFILTTRKNALHHELLST